MRDEAVHLYHVPPHLPRRIDLAASPHVSYDRLRDQLYDGSGIRGYFPVLAYAGGVVAELSRCGACSGVGVGRVLAHAAHHDLDRCVQRVG